MKDIKKLEEIQYQLVTEFLESVSCELEIERNGDSDDKCMVGEKQWWVTSTPEKGEHLLKVKHTDKKDPSNEHVTFVWFATTKDGSVVKEGFAKAAVSILEHIEEEQEDESSGPERVSESGAVRDSDSLPIVDDKKSRSNKRD